MGQTLQHLRRGLRAALRGAENRRHDLGDGDYWARAYMDLAQELRLLLEAGYIPKAERPKEVRFGLPASIVVAIKAICCRHAGITVEQLDSIQRPKRLAKVRKQVWWLIRQLCPDLSLQEIGDLCGGRDHSTVLWGIRRFEKFASTARGGEPLHTLALEACQQAGLSSDGIAQLLWPESVSGPELPRAEAPVTSVHEA
jgi:hypothetical protein